MDRLHIDPDIAAAHTMPASMYVNHAVFQQERERIFARSWQFVGDANLVRTPRDAHPFTLLEHTLDEPLLLVRGDDDVVRCLSNVCTHRGSLVCEQPGRHAHLRCRYHGRRFALDGRFQHMPEFEQTADFPSPRDDLATVPIRHWRQFLFVSPDPAIDFDALLADVDHRAGWLPIQDAVLDSTRSRDYLVNANWKLYCDNYLEGFHIPFVHASLNDTLDYGEYTTELFPLANLQLGVAAGGEDTFSPPGDSPDRGRNVAAFYFWLWPNLMFNVYPWGISINIVRPLAVDRTRVSFLSYVWDPARLDHGAGAALDRVEREDEVIVEAVQRGMHSRYYDRGRYSPTREQGVHHFHRIYAEHINAC